MRTFEEFCKMRLGLLPSDEYIRGYRFTNLHREADRSTRYYLNKCDSLESWIVACRYNRPSTLELCSFSEGGSLNLQQTQLNFKRHESVGGTFNSHVVTSSSWGNKSASLRDLELMGFWCEQTQYMAERSSTLSEFISRLRGLDRLGSFRSIQWGLNLSYHFVNLVIDKVPFQNGAKQGLRLVGKSVEHILSEDWTEQCGLEIVSLEHGLCEYSKYVKLCGNPRVLKPYTPSTEKLFPIKLPDNWKNYYGVSRLSLLHELYK